MPAKQKQNFLSQLTPAKLLGWLLDLATWIGTFVIEGLWWIAQFLWWMCNFVGSLVLSLFGLVMGLLGKSKRKGLGKFAKNIQKKTSKHRAGVIGKLMSKPVRRRLLPGLAVVLLFLTGFAVYRSRQAPEAEAGWWNETWIYRRAIDLENPSSTVENAQIKVFDEEDLSTLVSDGKLQSDLSDLRFTDYSGNLLQYYVEDDTSAAAEFWILIPSLIEGESVIFMYYGNANADSASSSAWMADLGGEISYFEGHRVHAFLEDGSYLNYHKRNIEHVIVAGGGGGGSRHGGGGGAGGVVHNLGGTPLSINPQSYNIVVGNGGLGASAGSASADSTNGEDSIAFGLTAVGGGKGTSTATPGSGGSGGGSRGNNTYSSGGDGIEGQGNRGGRGNSGGSMMGGGGGGYSEPGKDADTPNEGDGGDGLDASTFFGTSYGESGWFAGGGGGGNTGSRGLGGQGGGGNGGGLDGDDGQLGVPNTGGGGGAGGHHGENRPGKPGGSGIVLVRYQSNVNTPTDITIGSPAVNEEISPGPVAYWKFDEGTGTTANDASGQGNDGTLINSPTWIAEDQCVVGKCLQFNGTNQTVDANNPSYPSTWNDSFSISTWIYVPSSVTWSNGYQGNIISRGSYTGSHGLNRGTTDNQVRMWVRADNGAIAAAGTITRDNWHHLTGTWDGTQVRMFIDGKHIASSGHARTGTPSSTPWYIGRARAFSGASGNWFNGFLDEVKIYPYARSEEQIKADYAAGLAGMSTPQGASATHGSYSPAWMSDGLVGYWKMDEASWNGTSGEIIDYSGNNNHATGISGVTTTAGKYGNAGAFTGNPYRAEGPATNEVIGENVQQITISAWIKTTNTVSQYAVVLNRSSAYSTLLTLTSNQNNSGNSSSGYLGFLTRNNANNSHQWLTHNDSYNDGNWHHVVAVIDDLKRTLYINGEEKGTDQQGIQSTVGNTAPIVFGTHTTSGPWFNGSIDEVRIYNRALSPSEVKALYQWAPGPVAHYTFDSGDNNTLNDISGYGNNGTWSGSTAERYAPGKFGSAGVFNGSNDYVASPDSSNYLNGNEQSKTITAWIKKNNSRQERVAGIFDSQGSSLPQYSLFITADQKIRIQMRRSNGVYFANSHYSTSQISLNSWQHVAFTYDMNQLKIFVNGKLDTTYNLTDSIRSDPSPYLYIGTRGDIFSDEMFSGLIDDVRIYNYARTQKQILEDMAGGPPGTASRRLAEPIAHWRFDEGYGTTAHDAVGNNHGTFGAGAAAPTWTNEGKIGKALSFDGSSDYVDMGNVLNMGSTQDFSLTAWFKTDGTGTDRDTIINKGSTWWWSNATSNGYGMGIDCDWCTNCFCGSISDGTNIAIIESPQSVTDNKWHHGVITVNRQSQAMKLYLDGQLLDTTSISSIGSLDNTYHLVVSKWRHNQEQRFFHGLIDEVKIYNYALTPEEVKLDYNQGASTIMGVMGTDDTGQPTQSASAEYCIPGDTSHCAPPVARWDFEEGSGATAHDRSGNNNHGTLVNNPSWVTGKVGKALEFDGGNKVTFSNNLQITGNQPRTISAWFKTNDGSTGTSNFSIITGHGTTSTGNRFDFGVKDNKLAIGYWGSYTEGLLTINNNEWYHTAVVYDGTNTELFLNGVSDIKEVVVIDTPLGPPIIGDRGNDGHFFNGLIDQVRIYDYARTPAQVAWDYNRGAPIGHWRFDECQGNTAHDSSGNGNHGAINIGDSGSQTSAGTCTSDNSTYAWFNGRDGRINSALSFDGSDDHVNAGTNSVLNTGDTITYSAWVKLNSLSTETNVGQCIAGSYNPGYIFSLRGTSAGGARLSLRPHGGSGSYPTASEDLEVGKWHHVVGTHDGIAVRVYVDGIEKASNTYTNATNQARMIIGRASWSTSCALDGLIDDVKIYNYALTAEQVKILYNDGSAVKFGN